MPATKVVFTVTNGFEQDTQMHTLLLRAKGGGNTLNLDRPAKIYDRPLNPDS